MAYAQALDSTTTNGEDLPTALPQSTTQPPQYQDDVVQESQNGMRPVHFASVPDAIKKSLANPDNAGWKRGNIYFDETRNIYTVEMTKNNETRVIRFNKKGKRVAE